MNEEIKEILSKSCDQLWNEYKEKVISDKAGPTQISETKLAFYSGMLVIFRAVETMGDESLDPEKDELVMFQMLTNYKKDLEAYFIDTIKQQEIKE